MSISSELLTLQNTKTAIRTAINNKGGSVGANDPFASYATAITNLPSGGGSGNPLLTSIDVSDFTGTTFNRAASYITDVTIPSGVTTIGDYAFQYFSKLSSITIPSSVTSIGQYALGNCTSLTDVTIPNNVTSIANNALNGCTGLTSLTIGNSVRTIGSGAFNNCSSITSISIPNSVTSIGTNAFSNCSSITTVNADSLESWCSIDFNIAYTTGTNPISLPNTNRPTLYVNGSAITGNLIIPNTLTSISRGCFYNYSKITSVSIPDTITSIGDFAFQKSGISGEVTLPASITSLGQYALGECTGITALVVLATTPPTLGYSALYTGVNYPIYVPAESVDTYKAASGWSTYASRIYPIQQVATVDGNPVYNYELGMTSTTMIRSTEMAKMPTGTSLELAEGIISIDGETAFANYTNLTLPSTFATFGDEEMLDGPTTMICKAATPPVALHNNIGGANLTAIYVPSANVTDYQSASGWSTYSAITYPLYEVATVDGKSVYNGNLGATGQVTEMTSAMLAALPTGTSVKFSDGIDTFSGQIGAYEQVTLPASGSTQLEFTVASPINAATETLTVPFNAISGPDIVVANDTLGGAGLTEIIVDTDMCGIEYSIAVDALKSNAGFTTFADIIKAKPEDYMVITNLDVDPAPNGVITMSLAHAEQDTESQSPDALICYAPFTICKPSFAVDGETSNGTYTDSRGRTATYTPSLGTANIYNGDTLIASNMFIELDNSGIGQDWDSANDMWSIMVYTDSDGSGTDVVTLQPGMRVECFIDRINYDYDSEASCTPMAHSYITINVTA